MRIASLEQLDALIGRYVMDDHPEVFWEHSYSHWRFDNLDEALEALKDPFYSSLVPEGQRENLSVSEVRVFPTYSANMTTAIRVVESLGGERKPLTLCPAGPKWMASFGEDDRVEAASPSLAICMAALRNRGISVELTRTATPEPPTSAV